MSKFLIYRRRVSVVLEKGSCCPDAFTPLSGGLLPLDGSVSQRIQVLVAKYPKYPKSQER